MEKIRENPIKSWRVNHDMTQIELADEANLTRQVITNLEQGLMNSLPLSIRTYTAIGQEIYQDWVQDQRAHNSPRFRHPSVVFDRGWLTFRLSVHPTFRGFCRYLVFQPSVLELFERRHQNRLVLSRALSEVGVPKPYHYGIGVLGPNE